MSDPPLRPFKLPLGRPPAGSAPPASSRKRQRHLGGGGRKGGLTPLSWEAYFDEHRLMQVPVGGDGATETNQFSVYTKTSQPPPQPTAPTAGAAAHDVDGAGAVGGPAPALPVLLLLHGGGHSALSWALFAREICGLCQCRVVVPDLRGHGGTTTTDDHDLSIDTLCQDIAGIVGAMFPAGEAPVPPICLIGHSMGGAIAVHTVGKELLPTAAGLVVIDVVEGSALAALSGMQSFLRSRPATFESQEAAIAWSLSHGQLHNVESARLSMPAQLQPIGAADAAALDAAAISLKEADETAPEGEDAAAAAAPTKEAGSSKDQRVRYTWRVDLTRSEQYWCGWFQDLSRTFLAARAAKLLMLAGVDRLDKDLTIGQMQGKFQLAVVRGSGHSVQEDEPAKSAEAVAGFLTRMRLATPVHGGAGPASKLFAPTLPDF